MTFLMSKREKEDAMLDKVGCYPFIAEPFHCDFANRLFMGHLGNHMLNAADFHSNDRGFGMNYLNTIHKTWVLSRLSIEVMEMPKAYAKFHVETWVEGVMKFFTQRNYKVTDAETGQVYAYGRSIWAMIDTETRQPTDLLAVHDGKIVDYIVQDKECAIEPFSRVKVNNEAPLLQTIQTHYSDVDPNGHINSVKYIEHLLDMWDVEWYKKHHLRRIDVAYVAESHFGDKLHFYGEEQSQGEYCFCVKKEEACEEDKVEVCRIKLYFDKN